MQKIIEESKLNLFPLPIKPLSLVKYSAYIWIDTVLALLVPL